MTGYRIFVLALLLAAIAAGIVYAQSPEELQARFAEGAAAYNGGDFEKAKQLFSKIIQQTAKKRDALSTGYAMFSRLWRGMCFLQQSEFALAADDLRIAMESSVAAGNDEVYLSAVSMLGDSLFAIGQYDTANEVLEAGLDKAQILGALAYLPAFHRGVGNIQYGWGKYEVALEHYKKGLEYSRQLDSADNIVSLSDAIGRVYIAWADFESAIPYFQQAIETGQGSVYTLSAIDGLGICYLYTEQYDQALALFESGYDLAQQTGYETQAARSLVHSGAVLQQLGRYPEAMDKYHESLVLTDKYDRFVDSAVCLTNLGYVSMLLELYQDSAGFLKRSIEIKNMLRETAGGADRISYLESEIKTYALLIQVYLLAEDFESAFFASEEVSGKYLRERIAERQEIETHTGLQSIAQVQQKLDSETALIRYAVLPNNQYALVAVTDTDITGFILSPFGDGAPETQVENPQDSQSGLRGLTLGKITQDDVVEAAPSNEEYGTFYDSANRYYELIYTASRTEKARSERKELGAMLYRELLAPLESVLGSKNRIVVIPAGILSALPFETFVLPSGEYLIEKYEVSYAYSALIADIIDNRTYAKDRRPLLALGGAGYSGGQWSPDRGQVQLPAIDDIRFFDLVQAAQEQGDVRQVLSHIGVTSWVDIPATEDEVLAIAELFPDGDVYAGDLASERSLKSLSATNRLSSYRILHFAAHGFSLEEFPQLSSLVLGQDSSALPRTDGYLTAYEITRLNLAADFVNLSACQTGLGRLYLGEGVVGLAHAFVTAGANSLCVSLWQVADESTKNFMIQLYTNILDSDFDYVNAISRVKRSFIKSDRYGDPFFWAPFVIYGSFFSSSAK